MNIIESYMPRMYQKSSNHNGNNFYNVLYSVIDKHVPKVRLVVGHIPKCYTADLRNLVIRKRTSIERVLISYQITLNLDAYAQLAFASPRSA